MLPVRRQLCSPLSPAGPLDTAVHPSARVHREDHELPFLVSLTPWLVQLGGLLLSL